MVYDSSALVQCRLGLTIKLVCWLSEREVLDVNV